MSAWKHDAFCFARGERENWEKEGGGGGNAKKGKKSNNQALRVKLEGGTSWLREEGRGESLDRNKELLPLFNKGEFRS